MTDFSVFDRYTPPKKEIIPEEGGPCPNGCKGAYLIVPDVEGCSCHVSAPCSACVNNPLACNVCHEEFI